MFWAGFTVGLFVGANFGLFIATIFYLARARHASQSLIADEYHDYCLSGTDEKTDQESHQPTYISAQFQKKYPDGTIV